MYTHGNLFALNKCYCKGEHELCVLKLVHAYNQMEVRSTCDRRRKDINSNVRHKKTVEVRKEEVMAIRNRFPNKIPILVQRFPKETSLPHLDKSKFLVPQEITLSQFLTVIRNRMRLKPTQTLYLLINNRSMLSLSVTLAEAYSEYAGPDGFLYITYASQEVFGTS